MKKFFPGQNLCSGALHKTKGPAQKPISGTPPPPSPGAHAIPPPRKAIFGPPLGSHVCYISPAFSGVPNTKMGKQGETLSGAPGALTYSRRPAAPARPHPHHTGAHTATQACTCGQSNAQQPAHETQQEARRGRHTFAALDL